MTRKRAWEIGATVALLLAVAIAVGGYFYAQSQRRIVRPLGFAGTITIPGRDVTVTIEGNTCVEISGHLHCCIGHNT